MSLYKIELHWKERKAFAGAQLVAEEVFANEEFKEGFVVIEFFEISEGGAITVEAVEAADDE